jgi:hypothetical protein
VGVTAAAAAITILKPSVVFGTQANSAIRLGLLGCGGRGRNVTGSFLEHTSAVLGAIGDMFQDNLDAGRKELDEVSAKFGKPAVDPSRLFPGRKPTSSSSPPRRSTPSTSPPRRTSTRPISKRPSPRESTSTWRSRSRWTCRGRRR